MVINLARLAGIREKLHPTRAGYCAEPLDIDEARWLLAEVDRLRNKVDVTVFGRTTLDVVGTTAGKVTTEKRG